MINRGHEKLLKPPARIGEPFKTCSTCEAVWIDRADFMGNQNIVLLGYQSNFEDIDSGMILFNHVIDICGSTIAVPVAEFTDLYTGKKYSEALTGTDECEKRCVEKLDLERCNSKCKYAFVREILQILKK